MVKRGEWMGVPVAIKSINKFKKGTHHDASDDAFLSLLLTTACALRSQGSMRAASRES